MELWETRSGKPVGEEVVRRTETVVITGLTIPKMRVRLGQLPTVAIGGTPSRLVGTLRARELACQPNKRPCTVPWDAGRNRGSPRLPIL